MLKLFYCLKFFPDGALKHSVVLLFLQQFCIIEKLWQPTDNLPDSFAAFRVHTQLINIPHFLLDFTGFFFPH